MVSDTQQATVTRPQIRVQNAVKSFSGRVVVDIDGKAVSGRAVEVQAVRLTWKQKGGKMVEEEQDPQHNAHLDQQ